MDRWWAYGSEFDAANIDGACPGTEESPQDPRFKHPDWTERVVFNFFKESYLIWAKAVLAAVCDVKGLDSVTTRNVDFYTRQFVDVRFPFSRAAR